MMDPSGDEALLRHIDHPSGFLALSPKNRRFCVPGLAGFIAYREQGGHWFAFGGVHGPGPDRAALLGAFLEEARRRRRRVAAVQLRPAQAALFRGQGFTVNQLGSSYGLRLAGYRYAGTRRMKLRNKIKRARGAGLTVVELGREAPRDAAAWAQLLEISGRWLKRKRKPELDFMIGELGAPEDLRRRVFVARDRGGAAVGFISYVPAYGERPGLLHDLTRRTPDAPTGAMELCNAEAMARFQEEGVEYLHFGFTPFVRCAPEGPGASAILAGLIGLLARYGSFVYPAQSQVDYKHKWGPDFIDPELVAARPLSVRAVWDLLRLTRSL